jgi:hypothetical protein
VETRRVTVDGVEYVEVRDSELGGVLRVTVGAWEKHEAGLRAEGYQRAIDVLMAVADDFVNAAAGYLEADRALTEVRDEEEGNGDE